MRRSSPRLWSELSRSSNLVWLAALFIWFALSSSWYSHWHSLSHHLLRNKWLSAMHSSHQLHNPHAKHKPLPSLGSSTSWVNLRQLNDTHTEMDSTKKSASISDQQDWFHVSIEADDSPEGDTHLGHGSDEGDGFNQSPRHVASGRIEDQTSLARTSYQAPYVVQHDQARIHGSPKTCASVEEMGLVAAGTVIDSSLRVRKMITDYLSEHGASHVRDLPAEEFCHRGFVFGRAGEDGLGNDIYKILTAAGLSIMLNRSLIIAEHGSTNPAYFGLTGRIRLPFGDYLRYSNQTFSLSEVKRLWVKHDCAGVFRRPLMMITDDFQRPTRTKVFCEDWTRWQHPII